MVTRDSWPFNMALKTYLHCIQWLSQIVCHATPL